MRPFELVGEPLAEDRKKLLRQWISRPEMSLLHQVISAKGRLAEQEAIDQAHQAGHTGESQDRALLVGAHLLYAQKYSTALQVLEEIQESPDNWTTVKLIH
jgi:hypothetical protein